MDLVQLKIQRDSSLVKYVKIIRKFDSSVSVSTIKQRIEEDDFVVEFDLNYYDVSDEVQEIDKKILFRDMIETLIEAGAQISIFQNGRLSSTELLDNWLETINEIKQQTYEDITRES